MELKLYMFETCPFCRKVIREIEKEGRTDIAFHDIHKNEEDLRTLIEVGGSQQVPCLFIDGSPLYESDDIIKWLRDHSQVR
ncbi:MAG: glutathione S-transferase N-terminal domain-containing protein [Lachnospiraceae bacterium]|nr:glutathione S-transferase N-terminal domain-containing protein [Lachnospiraceae bacterium]